MTEQTLIDLDAARQLGAERQAASDAYEREHLQAFQAFHAGLEDKRNIVYMFFTGNLLHWLSRALVFVPADANVVLIGSDLAEDEIAWLRGHTSRPFHHVTARLDDNAVLDFIFKTAEHHFGWLHIDCFVLNPDLFGEMMRFDGDVAINCIWAHPGIDQVDILHSAFATINFDVLTAIRARGIEVSPCTYSYEGSPAGRTVTERPLYSRIPTPEQVELLRKVLPTGPDGLPQYSIGDHFEILELYQLVANALGYRLNQIRHLVRDGAVTAAHYSNEIIHVNGVSTYKLYKAADAGQTYIANQLYVLLLQADYAILAAMGADIPEPYAKLRQELEAGIGELGLDGGQVAQNLYGFLMSRGVSQESCARILGHA